MPQQFLPLFTNNLSSGWAEEVSAPLIRMFLFYTSSNINFDLSLFMMPIYCMLHTVCNIKPLN